MIRSCFSLSCEATFLPRNAGEESGSAMCLLILLSFMSKLSDSSFFLS